MAFMFAPSRYSSAPAIVEQLGDLADLGVEQPDRVRVGDHEDGRLVVEVGLQVLDVDQPLGGCS